ncbi:DUF748 domain-containing protein [Methylomagnum sp.]
MAITARPRKVGKLGIVLAVGAALLVIYAAVGFLLTPYLIRAQVLPRLSASIGATLTAEEVALNPFRLALVAHGIALKDKAGRELAACRELSVDVDGLASLAQRRLTMSGQAIEPVLRPALDKRGQLNFAALAPAGESGDKAVPPPFLITRFAVARGGVEFRDASRSQPFAVAFKNVALNLENLGLETDRKARFDFKAQGEARETVAAHGTLSLAPLVSEGTLDVAGVSPAAWLDWLAPDSPVRFRAGKVEAHAAYALRADGGKPRFDLRAGTGKGERLELAMRNEPPHWVNIGAVESGGLAFSLTDRRLTLGSAKARDVVTPWLKIAALSTGGLSYDLEKERFRLEAAELKDALALGPLEAPPQSSAGPAPTPASAQDPPRAVRLDSLRVARIDGSLQQQAISIGSVVSARAEMDLRQLADGRIQARGLPPLPIQAVEANAEAGASPAPPWSLRVGEIRLDGYSVALIDETVEPPVRLNLESAAFTLTNFSTGQGDLFHYRLDTGAGERGRITLDGEAKLNPAQANFHFAVDTLWLRRFQPYWQRYTGVDLARGLLNAWGDVSVLADPEFKLDFSGGAEVVDLATVDRKERKDVVRWKSLRLDGLTVNSQPRQVAIRTLSAEQAQARVVITKAGGLNLARDLFNADVKDAKPTPPANSPPGEAWPVVIGVLRIVDGGMDFEDETLEPKFMVDIRHLNGDVRGLTSRPDAQAEIRLEGRINHNSPVKIVGQLNPAHIRDHADVVLAFKGLNMTTLSPYSSKFAGYRIEKGKLDMDLRYRLHQGRLEAGNRMVLDQLVLGERVDSPTATTLPVDLAVALMKDSAGKIDLNLPISGRLDNPKFSLRGLYADAFGQLIAKLVGSPFALLGNLIDREDEDLGYVKFQPGEAALATDQQSKLGVLADALKLRPHLSLDIRGMADVRQDRLALAERALFERLKNDRRIELRRLGKRVWGSEAIELAEQDYRRLFIQFYRQSHPDEPEAKALATAKKPLLAEPDFQLARRKALERWAVSELDLRLLAQARGESIRDYLVRRAGVSDQRIYLLDVRLDEPGDREIKAFLSLSGS